MGAPFATAARAIAFAQSHKKRVFLCAETYAEQVTIASGVSVFGGLDCSAAKWTVADARAHFAAPASPAAKADNVQNATVVEAVEIVAPNATTPSGSSIGMIATSSPALSLVNVLVQSGTGMSGDPGGEGVQLLNGSGINGANGVPATVSSWVDVDQPGGAGGIANHCITSADDATAFTATAGGYGGTGGNYKSVQTGCIGSTWCWAGGAPYTNGTIAGTGGPGTGAAGANGANGASATTMGTFSAAGFASADGTNGSNGSPGFGGRGSDGASVGVQITASSQQGATWFGVGGAGGGSGGCPGLAGTAGHGGGASAALVVIGSPLKIASSTLSSAKGGDGGEGSFGSGATSGGVGGIGYNGQPNGQHGGAGGTSGFSGSGAGGPSVAIAYSDGLPTVDASTTLTPGTGGAGVVQSASGEKTIPASANGLSQALLAF
jgi:hypothetical protein